MKKILLSSLAALFSLTAVAQAPTMDNAYNKPYFGARLSIDTSIPGDVKYSIGSISYSSGIFGTAGGLSIGGIYNIPVVANLYIEPGLDIYYHTNSINVGNYYDDEYVENKDFNSRSLRKFGMRIPVQIGYHFDFPSNTSLHLFTGPVLNIGFSNDYYLTTVEQDGIRIHTSGSMYNTSFYPMQRVNFSWRIGGGVTFLTNYFVSLSGDIGMLNMMKNTHNHEKVSMHENGFQLTLGYNFR